jgi:GNAT superfamily N-acetyltransferase
VGLPILPDGFRFERLDTAKHDRKSFSCGIEALDSFFCTLANQNQRNFESSTHLLVGDQGAIVGFVTLVCTEIPLTEISKQERLRNDHKMISATLIARMAVDSRFQGQKFGERLLMHGLKLSHDISLVGSCQVVVVDPKPGVEKFYEKYGFQPFRERRDRFFLPLATVAKLIL